jgi:hypothetical protein
MHFDKTSEEQVKRLLRVHFRLDKLWVNVHRREFSVSQVLGGIDVIPSSFLLVFIFVSIILLIFGLCILEVLDEFFKFSMTVNIFRDGNMPVPGWPLECCAMIVQYTCA